MEINEITETIIGAAIAVHRDLGPSLLGYRLDLLVDRSVIGERQVVEPAVTDPRGTTPHGSQTFWP